MFKKIIIFKLNFAAKILIKRKNPEIIAITGSAGKTTTKDLVRALLSTDFEVLASPEGYNTEIGAPLAIFGERAPDNAKSIFAWMSIIFRCYIKAFFKNDLAEKIVMEFGADAPGDISYLVKTYKPQKGIVLTVLPVHLEKFINIESIAKEKGKLAEGVRRGGSVFLNIDNKYTSEMKVREGVERVTFGKDEKANFSASNIISDITGLRFSLKEGRETTDFKIRMYGKQTIYPILAAIAIARKNHISYAKIKNALRDVAPFKGRMNVLEGINNSLIIDDSYNANPESMVKSLEFLSEQKGRRVALLGTMNELGDYAKEGHELVGRTVAKNSDLLIAVGDLAEKYMVKAALSNGMDQKKIQTFPDSSAAGEYLKKIVKDGDIILAKGSQNNVRIEKAIELILKDQDNKDTLLVRQGDMWKNK